MYNNIHSHYNAMFFFKKINMSTFSGDSAKLWAVTISPAFAVLFYECIPTHQYWDGVVSCVSPYSMSSLFCTTHQCSNACMLLCILHGVFTPTSVTVLKPKCPHIFYLNDAGGAWRLTGFDAILSKQIQHIRTPCKFFSLKQIRMRIIVIPFQSLLVLWT